jgi:CubicO group peptidase (beta-lactamase class C family)
MTLKRAINTILLFTILFSFSDCKKSNNDIIYDKKYLDEIKEARQKAVIFLTSNFVPGASFAIAKDGKLIYSEGMGMASKELEVPATRFTKFRIGDLSEVFTSLIYHLMVEKRLIDPDSTVQTYITDFPEKQFKLQIKHLPYHTTGIRPIRENELNFGINSLSVQRGIEFIKNDTLFFEPGLYMYHSGFNTNLLGAVMEKVTNKEFPQILKEYLTDTLGLRNTVPDNPLITIKGRSQFFDYNYLSQPVNAISKDLRFCAPSEGLLSTAEDLVKFGNAFLYSEMITDDLKEKLFKPFILKDNIPTQMANGWFVLNDAAGRTIYGKSGGVAGGGASLIIYPEEKLVVACAINLTSPNETFPVFEIAECFLPKINDAK